MHSVAKAVLAAALMVWTSAARPVEVDQRDVKHITTVVTTQVVTITWTGPTSHHSSSLANIRLQQHHPSHVRTRLTRAHAPRPKITTKVDTTGMGTSRNTTSTGTSTRTNNNTTESKSHESAWTPTSSPAKATTVSMPYPLRGVNLGNWLVLEQWMNSTLFDGNDASDQYTFDQTDGAEDKLREHWETYFTEADFQQMASYGINAVRIPIGYWAYDNTDTPYITGADEYLERAVGWARNAGIKVLVDCHGSPGSQNGFDNSGHAGDVQWQADDNLDKSIAVLETMAKKYGSIEYSDVVFGLELVNEPISWDQNDFGTTQEWAEKAADAVKAAATNENLQIIMHDGFEGPSQWTQIGAKVNAAAPKDSARFAIDVHLYQNMEDEDSTLTQAEHIEKACKWTTTDLLPGSAELPVYVGEFSAATNICANPDGSTVAGSVCDVDGCQCANNVPIEEWQQPLKDATRKFFEAQIEAFEHSAQGWFIWSYHGYGAWSLQALIENGVLGKTVTDRQYEGICNL